MICSNDLGLTQPLPTQKKPEVFYGGHWTFIRCVGDLTPDRSLGDEESNRSNA